jgi:hypothetical protein
MIIDFWRQLFMKIHITSNKNKDIISIKYASMKFFDFAKINEILHIDNMFAINNLDNFSKGYQINPTGVNQIIKESKSCKNIWNIMFYDSYEGVLSENEVIEYLKKNKIHVYIDVNLSENEVHVLINQISFKFNVIDVLKERIFN